MCLKKSILVLFFIYVFSALAFAGQWTNNDPYKNGVSVKVVYAQFLEDIVLFVDENGVKYKYSWGPGGTEMTTQAKVLYSTLLTAFTTDRNVSIHYEVIDAENRTSDLVVIHE